MRQRLAAVIVLAGVLDVLNDGDGQGAGAVLHPDPAGRADFSDTFDTDHVAIGTDGHRSRLGDIKTHRALHLVAQLPHQIIILPRHLKITNIYQSRPLSTNIKFLTFAKFSLTASIPLSDSVSVGLRSFLFLFL